MKLRILKVTPEQLLRALQGKSSTLNLPDDTELIDVKYDAFTKEVAVVVRSESFEDVAEFMPIPDANLDVKTIAKKTSVQNIQPAISTNIGAGIKTLETKNVSKPQAQLKGDQDTAGIENEFTNEQRKLLRFSSDGDNVIVKPTQFLKAEWEDINDVVKSLGGQWVKGAVIPCWSIPKNQNI